MSHTETRREVEEWEVEVCDNCGHELSAHYPENGHGNGGNLNNWFWEGCCMIVGNPLSGGRILKARNPKVYDYPNPYPRCKCMKFI